MARAADLGLGRWWTDHRALYRLEDGQWVPTPRRIERAWAWLFRRGQPVRPAPRIFWIVWIAVLIASDVWGGDWGWWLFEHPQVAAGVRTGLYAVIVAAGAALLVMLAGTFLGRWKKSKKEM